MSIVNFGQNINPKYFQLVPLTIGCMAILVTIIIFSIPRIFNFDEQDVILSSSTIDALTGQSFRYILFMSLGMLIPFSTDHVFVLPSLLSFDILVRMESYMLPMLVIIMQSFSIYFLSQASGSIPYFWNYYMGTYIQFLVLYNAVLAIQANLAQKSMDVIIAIIISTVTTNIGIIIKICFLVQQVPYHDLQQYSWVILFGVATICNLYITRSWLLKYQVSQKTGLKNQPDIYAFCKILTLTCFLIAYNVEYLSDEDLGNRAQLLHNHGNHITTIQALLIGFFFLISEISYRRTKDMAKMSMEALETKRNFVRYVSHEIRTPLNTAILGLQLLEKEVQKLFIFPTRESSNTQRMVEKSDKKLKSLLVELVADTHQACNVSVEILNDLLMYEKIDGGLLVLDANEVLVVPFVKEALQMFVVQAKALSLDLIWKTEITNDIFVTIDSYKISQVIRNLVSNAMKFSKDDGKVTVSIEIINKSNRMASTKYGGFSTSSRDSISFLQRMGFGKGSFNLFSKASRDDSEASTALPTHGINTNHSPQTQQLASPQQSIDAALMENVMEQSLNMHSGTTDDLEQGLELPHRHTSLDKKTVTTSSTSVFSFFPSRSVSNDQTNSSTSPHKPQRHIYKGTHQHSRMDVIRIAVKDEGAGISKENQKRLFNEIVQFDAAKLQQGKGSGIGLWISNKIMKLHGGNIGVYSEGEDNGSLFYIDIPITRVRPRRIRPHDLYYEDLARGISLVHNIQPSELDEIDMSRGGDTNSIGEVIHRENSNLSSATGGNGVGPVGSSTLDQHNTATTSTRVKKQHHFPSTTSSFISMIAHSVFGSSSSSGSSGSGSLSSMHPMNLVARQGKSKSSHRYKHTSKVGIVDENEVHEESGDQLLISSHASMHAVPPASPSKRPTSLLIVDDSAVNRKMLKRSLQDSVDYIEEAVNGKDCVGQIIAGKQYDIVITDYFMPEMNGLEAVQIMRKELNYTGKIIGLTGNTESTMIEAFKQAGANMVLTKPFQGNELVQLIQDMLEEIQRKEVSNMMQQQPSVLFSPTSFSLAEMP